MASARDFRLQLDRWLKDECDERIRLVVQKVGIQILRRVILKTPVATGRLRGNWLVAIGAPDHQQRDRTDKSEDGADTLAEGTAIITGLTEPQAIWITNNLAYAVAIEAGSSKQAPVGMVAVTLAEVEAQFERIVE